MATATKTDRRPRRVARPAAAVPETAAIVFSIYEDNGGEYGWTMLGSHGDRLAQSVRYATRKEAEQSARGVRDSAGSAGFEPRPAGDRAVDVAVRRGVTTQHRESDAERWLDEGGSFSSEEVAKWQASR